MTTLRLVERATRKWLPQDLGDLVLDFFGPSYQIAIDCIHHPNHDLLAFWKNNRDVQLNPNASLRYHLIHILNTEQQGIYSQNKQQFIGVGASGPSGLHVEVQRPLLSLTEENAKMLFMYHPQARDLFMYYEPQKLYLVPYSVTDFGLSQIGSWLAQRDVFTLYSDKARTWYDGQILLEVLFV